MKYCGRIQLFLFRKDPVQFQIQYPLIGNGCAPTLKPGQ